MLLVVSNVLFAGCRLLLVVSNVLCLVCCCISVLCLV